MLEMGGNNDKSRGGAFNTEDVRRHKPTSEAPIARRDRIVVGALRCGRGGLGSSPSHGIAKAMTRQGVPLLPFPSVLSRVFTTSWETDPDPFVTVGNDVVASPV